MSSSATAAPARCIIASTSWPASAARISSRRVERLELSHRMATATACASSRECVIERSTEPTPSAAARSASRPERRTAGFGRPTISISCHANARATPKPSALPTASLPAKRPA